MTPRVTDERLQLLADTAATSAKCWPMDDTNRNMWIDTGEALRELLALRRQLAEANGALLRASAQLNGDGAIIGDGARIADASQLRALAGVKHGGEHG